jgi:signal transduction histidine kinase
MEISSSAVVVSLSDNGIGINDDLKDRLFEPNFTTKTSGMGLGLAITKNIIETSGGKIWFETIPEDGTIFYVKLPLCKEGE